jgi:septin family protein
MASGGGRHSQQGIDDGQIDYYDIMVIGKAGMGKTTMADKLLVANPQCRNYQGDQYSEPEVDGGCVNVGDLSIWLLSNAPDELERVTIRLKNIVFSVSELGKSTRRDQWFPFRRPTQ